MRHHVGASWLQPVALLVPGSDCLQRLQRGRRRGANDKRVFLRAGDRLVERIAQARDILLDLSRCWVRGHARGRQRALSPTGGRGRKD